MSRKAFASGSIWRSFRAQQKAERQDLPAWQVALKLRVERPRLRKVRNATFEDLSEAGHDVRVIEDGETQFVPPSGAMPERWKKPIRSIIPRVATLRNAELFKDGSVLLPDGNYCYFDTCFQDVMEDDRNFGAVRKIVRNADDCSGSVPVIFDMFKKKRRTTPFGKSVADISNNSNIMYFRPAYMNRRVLRILDPRTGDALIRPSRRRGIAVSGRCFSARSSYPDNMGHFMHDMLSRIYYEDLGAIAPGRERIIAPRFHFPMQRILFERIFEGYEIIHVPTDATLEVEELLLPANLCSPYRFNAAAISSLAKRLRGVVSPFSGKEKCKVCVSRSDGQKGGASGRNFVNLEDWEERMRKMGYRTIEISKLDPEAQFQLWANCEDIVGIHGAGMINNLMMPPDSNYTEIAGAPFDPIPYKYSRMSTVRCAMAAGHRTGGLIGNINGEGRPIIDLEALEAVIRQAA